MREILFRGRSIRTRDWYCGGIINTDCKIPPYVPEITVGNEGDGVYTVIDVDPNTVGQFTGLTDKNGKKIFEHDIVRCIRTMCDEKEMVGHIVYDECCFSVKDNKTPNQPAMDLCDDFEVIGNIHDNPELLEV